jgi:hypothetical protein
MENLRMLARYTVRRAHGDQRYSVWDNEKIAVFEYRECADLSFDDAFKMADSLNAAETSRLKHPGHLIS